MTYPLAKRNIAGMMPPRLAQIVETTMIWGGTSTGSANAQVISPEFTADMKGHPTYVWVAGYSNTGATTLSADGGTTNTSLRKADGTAMGGGEIVAGTAYQVVFDGTYWRLIGGAGSGVSYPTLAKSGAYTVTSPDAGKLIVATGTWTLSLPAAASVANGFAVTVINAGGGVITIDPNGAETVNGALTIPLAAMQSAILVTDNSAWYAVAGYGLASSQAFSTTAKSTTAALSNLGLTVTFTAPSGWVAARAINPASGKYYWEMRADSMGSDAAVCIVDSSFTNFESQPTLTAAYRAGTGQKQNSGASTAYGATWTTGDVIGVALDYAAGKIWFSKNGVWQGSGDPVAGTNPAFTGLSGTLYPAVGTPSGAAFTARFRVSDLGYSIPSGYGTLP